MLIAACIILLLAAILSGLLVLLSPGTSAQSVLPAQPGSLRWDGRSPVDILILGLHGDPHHSPSTDTITVASVDPAHHTIGLLALPADLWVSVPGYGEARLGDAYANGGIRGTLDSVQDLIGMPVPYYAAASYDVLRQIVDAYGGVSLNVAAPVTGRYPGDGPTTIEAGRQSLDGAAAVTYLLAPDEDEAARAARQLDLARALLDQATRPENLFRVPGMVSTMGGSIVTNVPYAQAVTFAHVLGDVPSGAVRSTAVGEQTSTASPYDGSSTPVLLPDRQRIHRLARSVLAPLDLRSLGGVAVLNGSGEAGQASDLSSWLTSLGVRVASVGAAGSYSYAHTEVTVGGNAPTSSRELGAYLAAMLQAPLVSGGGHTVSVIIGHDYQTLSQP